MYKVFPLVKMYCFVEWTILFKKKEHNSRVVALFSNKIRSIIRYTCTALDI